VKPFLTAVWSQLAIVNYEVPADLLARMAPTGLEIDRFQGRALVSMVGFQFEKTRLRGVKAQFHQSFEEVNLRFYVRRLAGNEWRRGVVFVKEIVPKFWVAFLARRLYQENYVRLPMRRQVDPGARARYMWRHKGRWNSLEVAAYGEASLPEAGTEEEFVSEHYWGYTAQRDGRVVEYEVTHPKWRLWKAREASLDCDVAALYGNAFAPFLTASPSSAFLVEGSEVTVSEPSPLFSLAVDQAGRWKI
jgi:hypothetical protein